MFSLRRLAVLALAGAFAAAFAGAADAARPSLLTYPETVTTPHFSIHFTGDLTALQDRITFQTAGNLGSFAEQAYSTIVTGWGYPAPLNDGDGRIDVWVKDLSSIKVLGLATTDAGGNTATGWITIDPTAASSRPVIAHELVHLVQYGQWITPDSWLREVTAEWASFAATDYVPFGGSLASTIAAPDMSIDCDSEACGNDRYEIGGYSRWTFFEYLSDRFGIGFVKDVFARGATLADPAQTGTTLLASTLVAKGATLSDVYSDYSVAHLASNYDVAGLQATSPAAYTTNSTGSAFGVLAVQRVPVNHLATRYLKFTRGSSGSACFPASLSLTVALPSGIGAKPFFFSKSLGSAAIPLNINGTTATVTVPWDTCFGGYDGYLSLPNPSLSSDAQLYTVSGTLTVENVVIPLKPPDPAYTGPTVASPAGDVAPAIYVYGAQLLRVSASSRTVRLIVFSSGSGKLEASLGGSLLATVALRAGNNDVRFKLPVSAVKALRKTSSVAAPASNLTLTSLSLEGVKGAIVTRKLTVVPAKAGGR